MSILKRQVSSSSMFASFFIFMKHNSSINFMIIHFLLWLKGYHQSSSFNTFECSGQNLPNYSCHFPSNKSVFFQILQHSSMSWKITPLYFFSSDNIYFAQKEPIKVKILEPIKLKNVWYFWVLRSKFVKFLMPILKQQVDSSPNFVSLFSFMKDNSSVLFLAWTIYTLHKRSPLK